MTDLNLQPPDPSLTKEYIPPNLRENIFSNQAIEGATSKDRIAIKKSDWVDFLDEMDQWPDEEDEDEGEEDEDEGEEDAGDVESSSDQEESSFLDDEYIVDPRMTDYETSYDPESFYYPDDFDLNDYTKAMLSFNQDEDDFYGILPDAMDYEDPVDKTPLIDN